MRKLVLILLLSQVIFAQDYHYWWNTSNTANTFSYDARTIAYFDSLDAHGIAYTQALKDELNDYFFAYFRPYGILDSLQAVYWIATDSTLGLADSTRVKHNLLNYHDSVTTVNALTWEPGLGVAGNGTSSYFNTNFNAKLDSSYIKYNSGSVFIYSRTNALTAGIPIGCYDNITSKWIAIIPWFTGNLCYFGINSAFLSVANSNSAGLFVTTRLDDTCKIYKGSSLLFSYPSDFTVKIDANFYVFCRNQLGTPLVFDTRQLLFFGWGMNLSAWGNEVFNTGMERWADYKGNGVQ